MMLLLLLLLLLGVGQVREFLRAGQRFEFYPVVPPGGRLRVPPLRDRRPRPPQK